MFKSNLVFVVVLVIESKGDVTGEGSQRRNDATTIFSLTQRYNFGTVLQLFETMSQQCCNAVLR